MTEGPVAAEAVLVDLVCALTAHDRAYVASTLAAPTAPAESRQPGHDVDIVANYVRQVPMSDEDRAAWLDRLHRLDTAVLGDSDASFAAVAHLLRTGVPRIPTLDIPPVILPSLGPELEGALGVVVRLDQAVAAPWTLIGGLMVLVTCAEHGVSFDRSTVDADVVAGVFTHRDALRALTRWVRDEGFADVTPPSIGDDQLAYRWRREQVMLDVTVPSKVNDQARPPRAVGGRHAVELPGTQQALRRTERLPVHLASGATGYVRRPDLLGAVVLKSQAAVSDRRDPGRHREDLVVLADLLAHTGRHLRYRGVMRDKDRRRIAAAVGLVGAREWRFARDPEAARAALEFLTATLGVPE